MPIPTYIFPASMLYYSHIQSIAEKLKRRILLSYYPLYLFDFDYTLVCSESAILKCFHITFDKFHLPQKSTAAIKKTIGLPMRDAVRILSGYKSEEEITAFIDAYKIEADHYMTAGTFFYPHTVETLRTLKANGARLGIVSNKTGSRVKEKFDSAGLDLIDYYVGSDDVKDLKPGTEGIKKALAFFQAEKNEALYIGDSVTDAMTAKNANLTFVGVTTGMTTHDELAAFPHQKIIRDIKELLTVSYSPIN